MKRQGIVIVFMLAGMLAHSARAQNEAPQPMGALADAIIQRFQRSNNGPKGLETRITVNIRDMDLGQAVRMLAEQSGINVTVGKDVDGKVSCSLTNVTARTALEAFLRSNGYTYVERDGVLVILKEDQVANFDKAAPVSTTTEKIIRRYDEKREATGLDTLMTVNVSSMSLAEAVRQLASQADVDVAVGKDIEGSVSCNLAKTTAGVALEAFLNANGYTFVERAGVLIVVKEGAAKDFDKTAVARKIVRQTFRIPYTGNEKEFVAGSTAPAKAEKVKPVDEIIREMLSARGKVAYYERQHLLVVEDDEDIVAMVEDFVAELWATPTQVFIDSRLLEITLEDGENFGVRWDLQNKVSDSGSRNQKTGVNNTLGTTLESVGPTMALDRAFTYGIVNSNIEVVLEAISTRSQVDLRSNPTVLVMNHRTASIIAGQEVPYVSSEESTGGNPIRTVEFKEVAIRLDVTPHVSEQEMVFLDVHPTVKSVIGYTEDPRQPIISTREAVTNVAIMNGNTLVIGGLVQRNRTDETSEAPILARIPLLGWFFRQNSFADTKNDLLFLLTPQVVTPEFVEGKFQEKQTLLKPLPKHSGELPKKDKPWWK